MRYLLLLMLLGCSTPDYDAAWKAEIHKAGISETIISDWHEFRDFYKCENYLSLKKSLGECIGHSKERRDCWTQFCFTGSLKDCS